MRIRFESGAAASFERAPKGQCVDTRVTLCSGLARRNAQRLSAQSLGSLGPSRGVSKASPGKAVGGNR